MALLQARDASCFIAPQLPTIPTHLSLPLPFRGGRRGETDLHLSGDQINKRGSRDTEDKNPITGIARCCARAASGHANAALPSSEINSRRFS
jgi:hypothetical protein